MMSRNASGDSGDVDSSSGRLLRDIEEISRALFLDKTSSKDLVPRSNHQSGSRQKFRASDAKSDSIGDFLHQGKKFSLWKWKPLKALGNRKFHCCFFLHIHSVEGLPLNFSDLSLSVSWKRKNAVLTTHPARVYQGTAEFEETLMKRCSVKVSGSGQQRCVKYEQKLFLLYASVFGAPSLDLGKHWIDLTRLLPLTLGELEEGKRSTGKWTTSFKLAGKAEGAVLNVSFGFTVLGNNLLGSSPLQKAANVLKAYEVTSMDHSAEPGQYNQSNRFRRLERVQGNSSSGTHFSNQSLEVKGFDRVFQDQGSEFLQSITFLYQKFEERNLDKMEKSDSYYDDREAIEPKSGSHLSSMDKGVVGVMANANSTVIEQGIEVPEIEESTLDSGCSQGSDDFDYSIIETINVEEIFEDNGTASDEATEDNSNSERQSSLEAEGVVDVTRNQGNSGAQSSDEQLELIFLNMLNSESAYSDSSTEMSDLIESEDYAIMKPRYKATTRVKSPSLDDFTESVANDFFEILGFKDGLIEMSPDIWPESSKKCLLRQFEEDPQPLGSAILNCHGIEQQPEFDGISSTNHAKVAYEDEFVFTVDSQHQCATKALTNRRNLKMLERIETESLMQMWGLNEKAFQSSPRISSGGFGSPVYVPFEEPMELPPLGEGLGHTIHMKCGGLLRSMNPLLFRNAKFGSRLVIQVSGSVVLPSAMGCNALEMLESWASCGVEMMSMQVNELMPLQDVTGELMEQLAWEDESESGVHERLDGQFPMNDEYAYLQDCENLDATSTIHEETSDIVSLKDLTPLVMAQIEALSIEGLRIQACMSSWEAPSRNRAKSNWKGAFVDISSNSHCAFSSARDLDLQHLSTGGSDEALNELSELSLTLDEWLRLDTGDLTCEDETATRNLKILAAHKCKLDFSSFYKERDCEAVKCSQSRQGHGILGDNLTLALRVQLRDPSRDYEKVGTAMVVLVEVERICVLSEQEISSTVQERRSESEQDKLDEQWDQDVFDGKEWEDSNHENGGPQFKISQVHVAGLSLEPGCRQIWGTKHQQQLGSRWLLSSGMSKTDKHPSSEMNAIIKLSSKMSRRMLPGNILWSISSHVQGGTSKWKESAAPNIYVRNPDIIFP